MEIGEAMVAVLERDKWLKADYLEKTDDRRKNGYKYLNEEALKLMKLPPPPPSPSSTYTPGKGDPTKKEPKETVPSTRPIDYTSNAICCCPSCSRERK